MSNRANLILAVEIFLLAIYAGSAFALARNSHDFILARREQALSPLSAGATLAFANLGDNDPVLLGGWAREPWGVRATTGRPELALKLPAGPTSIALSGRLTIPDAGGQHVVVLFDGRPVATLAATGPIGDAECRWSLALPTPAADLSVLTFVATRSASPHELGTGPGTIRTSLALERLQLDAGDAVPTCAGAASLTVDPAA